MKVDMSPEAVSMRLDTMGELWELSVALMDSTRIPAAAGGGHRALATEEQMDKPRYFENLNELQVRAEFEMRKDDRK